MHARTLTHTFSMFNISMAGEELKNRRYVEYKTFLINEYTHLVEFYTFPPFLSP